MSIMIPFRAQLRAGFLSLGGRVRRPSNGVHILNGHVLGMSPLPQRAPFQRLLGALSEVGELINIERACALIEDRTQVDHPMIAFTFDDGYRECHTDLAPVFDEFGVNAAFFINPSFALGDDAYIAEFLRLKVPDMPPRPPMDAAMIGDLAARGFIIGAHTMDHESLISAESQFLQRQVLDCRAAVEALSGQRCDYFAWTYGRYSDVSSEALSLAQATYRYVFSSDRYDTYTCNNGAVFNRRHFECDWPASHVRYFLAPVRRFEVARLAAE